MGLFLVYIAGGRTSNADCVRIAIVVVELLWATFTNAVGVACTSLGFGGAPRTGCVTGDTVNEIAARRKEIICWAIADRLIVAIVNAGAWVTVGVFASFQHFAICTRKTGWAVTLIARQIMETALTTILAG